MTRRNREKLPEEEITDEEAIEHFKKRVLEKLTLEEAEELTVVTEKAVYPFKDVLAHMEARDDIGRGEIEIEKEYIRELRLKEEK